MLKKSNPGDAIVKNVGNEQNLYKLIFCDTKHDVNEIDGKFIKFVSSAKERKKDIDRYSIFPSIDLITK